MSKNMLVVMVVRLPAVRLERFAVGGVVAVVVVAAAGTRVCVAHAPLFVVTLALYALHQQFEYSVHSIAPLFLSTIRPTSR